MKNQGIQLILDNQARIMGALKCLEEVKNMPHIIGMLEEGISNTDKFVDHQVSKHGHWFETLGKEKSDV